MLPASEREFIQMMERCRSEIEQLRATIATLEPKAHAYDQLTTVLGLLPKQSRGYGEDLVWTLRKRIQELSAKPNPAGEPPEGFPDEDAAEAA
jgi:hypothetical protein